MKNTKSVLVTGATGFIGRETVASLSLAGYQVTSGVKRAAREMKENEIFFDLTNPSEILALGNDHAFDVIVHLGAHVGWDGATESEMYVSNTLTTGCLAFLASQWNAHLVYASAAIVCGVRSQRIDSGTPVFPDTAYGRTKLLSEQLIELSHVVHCILRMGGVFGSCGPTHLGLNRAIDRALKGTLPTQAGTGAALRNYIYVKDVAEAIVSVLQQRLEGTHLLAGTEITSMNQMLQAICDIFLPGLQPKITEEPEAISQIIEPSIYLPTTRGFREALLDIKGAFQ